MKALWFSNVDISNSQMNRSGSWVLAMANALCDNFSSISITNISLADGDFVKSIKSGQITQIGLLINTTNSRLQQIIKEIVLEQRPDIIHIWGTECFTWCWSKSLFDICPVIVDMQGMLSTVVENFYGGLTLCERIKCIRLKELIKPTSSLQYCKYRYKKKSIVEREIIESLSDISVQSNWIENQVLAINPTCNIIKTRIVLRPEFYYAHRWKVNSRKVLFSTATMVTPLKGLHLLLKSLSIIKKVIPDIKLRLAGGVQTGIRKSGYAKLILSLVDKYNLRDNVVFLGELTANDLIKEYQNASVFVNPSFVESYSLVVAEAMYIGTPVVASYVGGMAELGENMKSILYFPKGDYVSCAFQVLRLLRDKGFSQSISKYSIEVSTSRYSLKDAACRQMDIYNSTLLKR